MPRTARSRSADGVTIAALLPPNSSSTRPNRCATRGPTSRPIRTDPVADTRATPRIVDQDLAGLPSTEDQPADLARRADVGGGALDQGLAGDRGQRGQVRRLPDHGVAAHQGDGGIPRPHRDREVERGDDGDDTQRVPGFHQAVTGAFGGDGLAVQLPRQADREFADVDHLLHLAECLGGDLARLDRHQRADVGLVRGEQFAEPGHQGAAHRGRGGAPGRKRLRRFGNGSLRVGRTVLVHREQNVAGDRGARRQAVPGGCPQVHFGAHRAQGRAHPVA